MVHLLSAESALISFCLKKQTRCQLQETDVTGVFSSAGYKHALKLKPSALFLLFMKLSINSQKPGLSSEVPMSAAPVANFNLL